MTASEPLMPKHGGYRKLKSFQVAQLIYDITVRFCDRYIEKRSRTHDQMVQAARSGGMIDEQRARQSASLSDLEGYAPSWLRTNTDATKRVPPKAKRTFWRAMLRHGRELRRTRQSASLQTLNRGGMLYGYFFCNEGTKKHKGVLR